MHAATVAVARSIAPVGVLAGFVGVGDDPSGHLDPNTTNTPPLDEFRDEPMTLELDHVAGLRNPLERGEDEPSDRVEVLVGQVDAQSVVEVVDVGRARDDQLSGGELLNVGSIGVVLVDDLSDEFLEAVLQGDDTSDIAVLVSDDREM